MKVEIPLGFCALHIYVKIRIFVSALWGFIIRPLVIVTSADVVGEESCQVIRENVFLDVVGGGFGDVL